MSIQFNRSGVSHSPSQNQAQQALLRGLAARLERASELRQGTGDEAASGIARPTDRVEFDELNHELDRVGAMIKQMSKAADRFGDGDTAAYNEAIQRIIGRYTEKPNGGFGGGLVADLSYSAVMDVALAGSGFAVGDELDLSVSMTQSAQRAGMFLELGANASGSSGSISLSGSGESFVIEIQGTEGSIELSFSSGQTLGEMAAAINSFTGSTGLRARASGTGIKLVSTEFGSEAFTSVRVVNDAQIADNGSGNTIGIYRLQHDDFNSANPWITSTFASASSPERDEGLNGAIEINGISAELIGGYWVASLGGQLDVALRLNLDEVMLHSDPFVLGTVSKPKHGHGSNGLNAPAPTDGISKVADGMLRRLDLEG